MACHETPDRLSHEDVNAGIAEEAQDKLSREEVQQLQDRVLIIVGQGPAVERLARRRLELGGRLCVVEVDPQRALAAETVTADGLLDLWAPPDLAGRRPPALAVSLRARPRVGWIKQGPDVVDVLPDEELHLMTSGDERVGVRVTRAGGSGTVWEMSGRVIVNPSLEDAERLEVNVQDIEQLPLQTFDPKLVFLAVWISIPFCLPGAILNQMWEPAAVPGEVPWWRGIMWAGSVVPQVGPMAGPFFAVAFTGFQGSRRYKVCVGLAGIIVICVCCALGVASFLACVAGFSPSFFAPGVLFQLTKRRAPRRQIWGHAVWLAALLCLTAGSASFFLAIELCYLAVLAAGHPILAALFLSAGIAFTECFVVNAIALAYVKVVRRSMAERPGCFHGSPRIALDFCPAFIHGVAESARLAALLAGTAGNPDDLGWVFSVVQTFVTNTLTRSGWLQWCSSWVQLKISSPTLGDPIYATWPSIIHQQCKNFFGYPRFVGIVFVVVPARLAINQAVDPGDGKFFFFNTMTMVAVIAVGMLEVLEDFCVNKVVPRPPFLDFHEKAHLRLPTDFRQLVAVTREGGRQDAEGYSIAFAGKVSRCWGRVPHTSPLLHGLTYHSFTQTLGAVLLFVGTFLQHFELMLGAGYVHGACSKPFSEPPGNIPEQAKQFFFVDVPYVCP